MFYEDDFYEKPCVGCEEKDHTLDLAHRYLKSAIDQLFSNEPLNVGALEVDLENLCDVIGVDIPKHDICIQRKPNISSYPSYLQQWIEWNQLNINQIANL